MNLPATTKRRVFARLSIPVGNSLQTAGILTACFALRASRSAHSAAMAVIALFMAWVLLYFSSHAIAHWLVGRLVGIRFLFYTVGGTGNPEGWPPGLRWIFEHLPFLGVQTEKLSMQSVSPRARALMWSAGVTSSAIIPWARCGPVFPVFPGVSCFFCLRCSGHWVPWRATGQVAPATTPKHGALLAVSEPMAAQITTTR